MALPVADFEEYIRSVGSSYNQLRSFNNFLDVTSHNTLKKRGIETVGGSKIDFVKFEIEDLSLSNKVSKSPEYARRNNLTYGSEWTLVCNITDPSGNVTTVRESVGNVPMIIGCSKCFTQGLSRPEKIIAGEDHVDRGGYAIIRGMEMMLVGVDRISVDRMISTRPNANKKKKVPETRLTSVTPRGTDLNIISISDSVIRFALPSIDVIAGKAKHNINAIRLYMILGITKISDITDMIMEFIPEKHSDEAYTVIAPSIADVLSDMDHIGVMSEIYAFSSINAIKKKKKKAKGTKSDPQQIATDEDIASIIRTISEIQNSRDFTHTSLLIPRLIKEFDGDSLIDVIDAITSKSSSATNKKLKSKMDDARAILIRFRTIYNIEKTLKTDLFRFVNSRFGLDASDSVKSMRKSNEEIRSRKLKILSMMIAKHIMFTIGAYDAEDKDSWTNKRILLSGDHFVQKLRGAVGIAFGKVSNILSSEPQSIITAIARNMKIDQAINRLFFPPREGSGASDSWIARYANGTNNASLASNLNIVNAPVSSRSTCPKKRELTKFVGFMDPVKISENPTAGLVKHVAILTRLAVGSDPTVIIHDLLSHNLVKYDRTWEYDDETCKVVVAGAFVGWSAKKYELRDHCVKQKRIGAYNSETAVVLTGDSLFIETSNSYLLRPLLVVDIRSQRLAVDVENDTRPPFNMEKWIDRGWVQLISPWEQDQCIVARNIDVLNTNREVLEQAKEISNVKEIVDDKTLYKLYDYSPISNFQLLDEMERRCNNLLPQVQLPYAYCELWKADILGWAASMSPHVEQNQAPRNAYQSGMIPQCLGNSFSNSEHRYHETVKRGPYTRGTISNTSTYRALELEDQGTADLLITMFSASDSTEEDGFKYNADSVARGVFGNAIDSHIKVKINKNDGVTISFLPEEIMRQGEGVYDAIYKNGTTFKGYPKIGSYVSEGMCVLSSYRTFDGNITDSSQYLKFGEEGIIRSITKTVNEKNIIISIVLTFFEFARIANKGSSENSQKGTINAIVPADDLPFTEQGLRPDIITTVHSIPTRMTVSSFSMGMETAMGSLLGANVDSTAFEDKLTFRELEEAMSGSVLSRNLVTEDDYKFDGSCYYSMRNGCTGERIRNKMFMVMLPWQILRHLVKTKYQSRGYKGPRDSKTKQPVKGRSRIGGLKFEVMARDAAASAGASTYLQQRFVGTSNPCDIVVCEHCGEPAIPIPNVVTEDYREAYKCPVCDSGTTRQLTDKKFLDIKTTVSFTNIQKLMAPTNIKLHTEVIRESNDDSFLS